LIIIINNIMEIEEKIITEIQNYLLNEKNVDTTLLSKINKFVIYESVKVEDREKTEKDAINYVENKLYDLFTKKI